MQEQKTSGRWFFLIILIFLFIVSYGNQILYRYAVPPGMDAYNHNTIVLAILAKQYNIFQYHTVWHITVGLLATLFHANTLTVMAWLSPALLISMALSLYYFNNRFFGQIAGIASLIIMGFFSLQPLQTLNDGGFPNVLAAGTVLPFVFILFDKIFVARQKIALIFLFLASLILLIFSHHLTALYTFAIIFIFLVVLFLKTIRQKGASTSTIIYIIILLIPLMLALVGWLLRSPLALTSSTISLAAQFVRIDLTFPFVHLLGLTGEASPVWNWPMYLTDIGGAVTLLGAVGYVIALSKSFRSNNTNWRIYLLLTVWVSVLFIGSRIPGLSHPGRLSRDMAVPLVLLGGIFIQTIYDFIRDRRLPSGLFILFLVTCLANGWVVLSQRIQTITQPSPLISHLKVDSKAADYITKNLPSDARIMMFQEDIYLDYFTPQHKVEWFMIGDKIKQLVTYTNPNEVLKNFDYFYLEERYNKPGSFTNNPDITKNYLRSPYARLVTSFEQPEKKVYLFQVVHQSQSNKRVAPTRKTSSTKKKIE